MRIFGVDVIYDAKETLKFKEQFSNQLTPKKARKLRAYEVTNLADRFRKWRCAFGFCDVLKIYFQTVIKYWFFIRPKYLRWLNTPGQGTVLLVQEGNVKCDEFIYNLEAKTGSDIRERPEIF